MMKNNRSLNRSRTASRSADVVFMVVVGHIAVAIGGDDATLVIDVILVVLLKVVVGSFVVDFCIVVDVGSGEMYRSIVISLNRLKRNRSVLVDHERE